MLLPPVNSGLSEAQMLEAYLRETVVQGGCSSNPVLLAARAACAGCPHLLSLLDGLLCPHASQRLSVEAAVGIAAEALASQITGSAAQPTYFDNLTTFMTMAL